MTARAVLLTADERAELERIEAECASPAAARQYLAELLVLRQLHAAARARRISQIETALRRLSSPSIVTVHDMSADVLTIEPPPSGSERLL